MKARNITRYIIGTVLVLLVPLVAMPFSDDVNWNWFDFVVMGILLLGAGLIYELVTAKVNTKYRGAIGVVFVGAVLLIWAELAVGVLGSPLAGS